LERPPARRVAEVGAAGAETPAEHAFRVGRGGLDAWDLGATPDNGDSIVWADEQTSQ
jgi:hypothetical protein